MPTADTRPLLLTNARLIDPATGRDERGGLLMEGGIIRDWGPGLTSGAVGEGTQIRDCKGHVVAPGLIDMRVFCGEPGAEHRETLKTASHAAAAGGVTTMIASPNTTPPIDDPAVVDFVLRRAREKAVVRVQPAAALTKGLEGREMTEIGLLKEAGSVVFTDGPKSIINAQVMRRALIYSRLFDVLVMHHVEDPHLVGDGVMNEGEFATRLGLQGVPRDAESIVLERDIRLVRLTGARYHASIISCPDSIDIIRRAKDEGLRVTAGTSINHLTLNENDVGDYRTFCRMAPPLRLEADRLAVVAALAEGVIDVIVSDHNPQDVETKRLPFAEAADGAIGLETMLSAALRLVEAEQITLVRLLAAFSTLPAKLLGIAGGTLRPGSPADLIELDLEHPWVVDRKHLRSRSKNSPFDGARMTGRVMMTIVAGRIVYEYA